MYVGSFLKFQICSCFLLAVSFWFSGRQTKTVMSSPIIFCCLSPQRSRTQFCIPSAAENKGGESKTTNRKVSCHRLIWTANDTEPRRSATLHADIDTYVCLRHRQLTQHRFFSSLVFSPSPEPPSKAWNLSIYRITMGPSMVWTIWRH